MRGTLELHAKFRTATRAELKYLKDNWEKIAPDLLEQYGAIPSDIFTLFTLIKNLSPTSRFTGGIGSYDHIQNAGFALRAFAGDKRKPVIKDERDKVEKEIEAQIIKEKEIEKLLKKTSKN